MAEYVVKFYRESKSGRVPLDDFLDIQIQKVRLKILKYVEYLRIHNGYLDEPYSKHITGKIRELRVDFASNHFRIFYFVIIGKRIILLHGFKKTTKKTPKEEILLAETYCWDVVNNINLYD